MVVKHNTGNIWLAGKADISLDDLKDHVALIHSTAGYWCDISGGAGGGGGSSTFTGLTDTPGDYTGHKRELLAVTDAEAALNFIEAAGWLSTGDHSVGDASDIRWQPDCVALLRDGVVTEYDDPDDAFNDATQAGDIVLIPPGTWTLSTHHSVVDVSVIGLGGGPEDCLLQSTWNPGEKKALIQLNDSGVAMNFSIKWDVSSSAYSQMGLYVESGAQAYYVKAVVNVNGGTGPAVGCNLRGYARRCVGDAYSTGGNAYGVFCYDDAQVMDCEGYAETAAATKTGHGFYISKADEDKPVRGCLGVGTATGGGTGIGLHVGDSGAEDCYVSHSHFEGDTYDLEVEYSTAYLYSVRHESESLTDGGTIVHMGGDRAGKARAETITGQWTFDRTSGPTDIHRVEDTAAAAVTEILRLVHELSSGTAAAGMGARVLLQQEDSASNVDDLAAIEALWDDAASGSEDSAFAWLLREGGAALARYMKLTNTALLCQNTQELNIGSTTDAEKWGHVYLAQYKDVFPDDGTHAKEGIWRRFVNKLGLSSYTHHRGTGTGVPSGTSVTSTPSNLWTSWKANYYGWLYNTYYAQYPDHASLPAGLTVASGDPLSSPTVLTARVHTTGSSEFGLWTDNFDSNRSYAVDDYIYRYDVYAYGNGPETLLYTQVSTSKCTAAGVGGAATFAAWVRHAKSGPYGPFCPCGDGVVIRLRANHNSTATVYPYVIGEQGATSGLGASQTLYDDAWPGSSSYAARRIGTFHRLQGYAWASWDWYYLE